MTRQRLTDTAWVRLEQAQPLNTTAVRLTWQLLDGDAAVDTEETPVDGLYLWYRPLGSASSGADDAPGAFSVATIVNPMASGYTLSQLKPFTRYLLFLVPFYRNLEGRPSNSKIQATLEAGAPLVFLFVFFHFLSVSHPNGLNELVLAQSI